MRKASLPASAVALAYHEATKHRTHRPARALGYLDWANEPEPWRMYAGAPRIDLPLLGRDRGLPYGTLYEGAYETQPVSLENIGAFLELSMGLSAWKRYGSSQWALRMNPSSGNLHPTECYLLLPPIGGMPACVAHYSPRLHALERLYEIASEEATRIERLGGFGVILTSIYWREAWKYGERAYRYCNHDAGHALAALRFAANLNGWSLRMQPRAGEAALERLLGFDRIAWSECEEECAHCLCWAGADVDELEVAALVEAAAPPPIPPRPNRLSAEHVNWDVIARTASACRAPGVETPGALSAEKTAYRAASSLTAEAIIRRRRSALGYDRDSSRLDCEVFLHILERTLPGSAPFDVYPYTAHVNLALFVHNVTGLDAGLYCFVRNTEDLDDLRTHTKPEFAWRPAVDDVPLYVLKTGNFRAAATHISCGQDIAGESAFSLGMLARFEEVVQSAPWMYPRLFWETGVIGQVLYLEAEAHGLRGTGIGCYFDDEMHALLGLRGRAWQDLYHFTVGAHLDDPRLQTLEPYHHLRRSGA